MDFFDSVCYRIRCNDEVGRDEVIGDGGKKVF